MKINEKSKLYIKADKANIYYKLEPKIHVYETLVEQNITETYKKSKDEMVKNIEHEAKSIACDLDKLS